MLEGGVRGVVSGVGVRGVLGGMGGSRGWVDQGGGGGDSRGWEARVRGTIDLGL